MKLKATIDKKTLDAYLQAPAACGDEAKIEISGNGFKTLAVDAAHVMMMQCVLPADAFERYDAAEGVININIATLRNKLKVLPDSVVLRAEEGGRLHAGGGAHEFTIPLLNEATTAAKKMPELDLPFALAMETAELRDIVRAAALVGDHFNIAVDGDRLSMGAESSSYGSSGDYVWAPAAADTYISERDGDAKTMLSMEYINAAVSALAGDEVQMRFGDDMPARLYSKGDSGLETLALIAPRIEGK